MSFTEQKSKRRLKKSVKRFASNSSQNTKQNSVTHTSPLGTDGSMMSSNRVKVDYAFAAPSTFSNQSGNGVRLRSTVTYLCEHRYCCLARASKPTEAGAGPSSSTSGITSVSLVGFDGEVASRRTTNRTMRITKATALNPRM